jgi:uncharacterized membrane protein
MIQFFRSLLTAGEKKDNAALAAIQLVEALGIRATAAETEKRLKWNPSYPGIHSLQALLTQWQAESMVLEVEKDKLDELPPVFLCHTHSNGGEFRVVVRHQGDEVIWLDDNNQPRVMSRLAFTQAWSGVVLLAENNPNAGMPAYAAARRLEWWGKYAVPLVLAALLVFTIVLQLSSPALSLINIAGNLLVQLLNLTGLAIAIVLLQYQVNDMHPAAKKLCSMGGEQDCSKVLKSGGAKIFGITLSEAGFIWFAAGSLYVLQGGASAVHALCCYACLLFIPYSLYYQKKVAKQWCVICLLVLSIFVLQALVYVVFTEKMLLQAVTITGLLHFAACLLIPAAGWFSIKKMATAYTALQLAEQDYFRLKHNPAVFNLLQAGAGVVDVAAAAPVVLNPDAEKAEITIVSSPNCGPCGDAHAMVQKAAALNPHVKFSMVFVTSTNAADSTHQPVKHLLGIYKHQGEQAFTRAMHYWYSQAGRQYPAFNKAFPYQPSLNGVERRQQQMEQWVLQHDITATPTYFVNGKKLPDNYGIEDIMVMLANL